MYANFSTRSERLAAAQGGSHTDWQVIHEGCFQQFQKAGAVKAGQASETISSITSSCVFVLEVAVDSSRYSNQLGLRLVNCRPVHTLAVLISFSKSAFVDSPLVQVRNRALQRSLAKFIHFNQESPFCKRWYVKSTDIPDLCALSSSALP